MPTSPPRSLESCNVVTRVLGLKHLPYPHSRTKRWGRVHVETGMDQGLRPQRDVCFLPVQRDGLDNQGNPLSVLCPLSCAAYGSPGSLSLLYKRTVQKLQRVTAADVHLVTAGF